MEIYRTWSRMTPKIRPQKDLKVSIRLDRNGPMFCYKLIPSLLEGGSNLFQIGGHGVSFVVPKLEKMVDEKGKVSSTTSILLS